MPAWTRCGLSCGIPTACAMVSAVRNPTPHTSAASRYGIQKLIDEGAVTRDFGDVLHYVRKLGNLGAHYTDEKLSHADVERALRFTVQLLRNLFEVPGELAQLNAGGSA